MVTSSHRRRTVVMVMPSHRRSGAERNLELVAAGVSRIHDVALVDVSSGLRLPDVFGLVRAAALGVLHRRRWPHDAVVVSTLLRADVYAWTTGRPFICSYETDWSWHLAQMGGLQRRLYGALVRRTLKAAAAVVLPSPNLREQVVGFGIEATRLHVVPNAVPFTSDVELAQRSPGPDVVVVGRLVPQKDPLLAVAAIREARARLAIRAEFVGDGPMRSQVEAEIERLGLEEHVTVSGWTDRPLCRVASARVLLSTSLTETFGNVMAEALSLGVPVVATTTSGSEAIATLCPQAVDLVRERTPGALGAALVRRLESPVDDSAFKGVAATSVEAVSDAWLAVIAHVANT